MDILKDDTVTFSESWRTWMCYPLRSERMDFCMKPDTEVNGVATWRHFHYAGICKLVGKSAKVEAACSVLKVQERKLASRLTDKAVMSCFPAPELQRLLHTELKKPWLVCVQQYSTSHDEHIVSSFDKMTVWPLQTCFSRRLHLRGPGEVFNKSHMWPTLRSYLVMVLMREHYVQDSGHSLTKKRESISWNRGLCSTNKQCVCTVPHHGSDHKALLNS